MNNLRNFGFFLLLPLFTLYAQNREFKVEKRFINLPVQNQLDTQNLQVLVGDTIYREFDIQLAESDPDFWVPLDMKDYQGKSVTIKAEKPSKKGLDLIYQSEQIAGYDSLYTERLRPQIHFTSQRGWINDPNGLVYNNGEYHLYYQHNPFGWSWGNMHWGNAVSKDLVHWKELPTALYPPTYQDMAFSGSAVIDTQNTSGFSSNDTPPLVVAFTSTGRGECIVYSLDNGRTFKEYAKNPVLKHQGRDPKIFWYAPDKHWVMVVYNELPTTDKEGKESHIKSFQIHTSTDLKNWEYQSEILDFYECPELFELPIDDNPKNSKWVMYGADGQYFIGDFNGKIFTPQTPKYQYKTGNAYASQTYNNTPDGKRIQMSWGNGIESKGMPFNQLMLFPTELKLHTTDEGVRMFPKPIDAINALHKDKHIRENVILSNNKPLSTNVALDVMHLIAEFNVDNNANFGMDINGFNIDYNAKEQKLNDVEVKPINGKLKLEIIVDRTSIEIFANDGRAYIVKPHIAKTNNLHVNAYSNAKEEGTRLNKFAIYEMKSIWE